MHKELFCRDFGLTGSQRWHPCKFVVRRFSNMDERIKTEKLVEHHNLIQKEFTMQAEKYAKMYDSGIQQTLGWIKRNLDLNHNMEVLDVATGTGAMSRLIAPHVKTVKGLDLTSEMLRQAKKAAETENIKNLELVVGNAEQLPFKDNTFDLVCSRFALHHWKEAPTIVKEMARVCKPGGVVAIVDIIVPLEYSYLPKVDRIREKLDYLETIRDPSHIRMATLLELKQILSNSNLEVSKIVTMTDREMTLKGWGNTSSTPKDKLDSIQAELSKEIQNQPKNDTSFIPSGMRPFLKAGEMCFWHFEALVTAKKL